MWGWNIMRVAMTTFTVASDISCSKRAWSASLFSAVCSSSICANSGFAGGRYQENGGPWRQVPSAHLRRSCLTCFLEPRLPRFAQCRFWDLSSPFPSFWQQYFGKRNLRKRRSQTLHFLAIHLFPWGVDEVFNYHGLLE